MEYLTLAAVAWAMSAWLVARRNKTAIRLYVKNGFRNILSGLKEKENEKKLEGGNTAE